MNCPLCIDQTLTVMHRGGVELDVCPKCKGIWLDRGEIDRLAADPETESRANRRPNGESGGRSRERSRNDRDRDDDDRDRSRKRRKKSLAERIGDAVEDVFDF